MENLKDAPSPATDPKYNERKIIKRFLSSDRGFKRLLQIGKKYKFGGTADILDEIDGLVDLFSTWTVSFPVRKNLKVSKYDFLKHIEVFCADKENNEGLDEIFKDS